MEVLSKDLEAFLNQLVEFAGDSGIAQRAIANVNRRTSHPSVDELVREILVLKAEAARRAADEHVPA